MKKRNRMNRRRFAAAVRKPLGLLSVARERKPKSWTFERLEDRMVFSVSPAPAYVGYSNATAEGQLATVMDELRWNALVAANVTGSTQRDVATLALPNDPLFQSQWHLLNTGQEVGNPTLQELFALAGQDINVIPVWNEGITGEGVLVAVIDTGVQLFHPDLTLNFSPTLRLNAINGTGNVSPDLFDPSAGHGTSVAGIIGAVANNGLGGSGVAPGVTLVPIKLIAAGSNFQSDIDAFQWAYQNGIDITNNSWGFVGNGGNGREAIVLPTEFYTVLRNSVINGRDGLGMINVFASGNNAGPFFTASFPGNIGNYDSSTYNALANSRYTITVTGVDHDGLYINADGTFTTYPMAGANVLVAAPTGSNGFTSVGEDDGYGSGIWTTDLVGDFGYNAAPDSDGIDQDSDFLADPNYTSRFNGTSASAPMVSGVIALMLEANPNLTYRDVQEILVRSARQNAQFESPSSGGLSGNLSSTNTWQVNQIQPWREVDDFFNPLYEPFNSFFDPIADPSTDGFSFLGGIGYAPDTNDGNRQYSSQYEPQPPMFTTGSGYTVSQGYGVYSEMIGYGHGTIDAGLAVAMAKQWHTLNQNTDAGTERTFTTGVINQGPNTGWALPAGVRGASPPNGINWLVPGGIGGIGGFIPYYDQFFVDDPFANYTGPGAGSRGASYMDFAVPPSQGIDVEWVEVRIELDGSAADLDSIRIFLVSPEGTQSELNHFYGDTGFATPFSVQPTSRPPAFINPVGDINNDDTFLWTFSTNRSWGESSNSAVIIHPATGEPLLDTTGGASAPIFRNWELHVENWSTSSYSIPIVEVIWHGKPISGGSFDPNYAVNGIANAQRVQGFVGIDANGDEDFNYSRYIQTVSGNHSDISTIRTQDIQRVLDFEDINQNGILDYGIDPTGKLGPLETINQEAFAANILVEARRVFNGVVESDPVAQFLTGADGNYYFDLNVQSDIAYAASIGATFEYQITATDPLSRALLEDVDTPALVTSDPQFTYLPHFKQQWTITPDWFYAPDRDNPLLIGDNPGEIFYDPIAKAPAPFTDSGTMARVPMPVKNVNFLLKEDALPQEFDVEGTVYADLNGNGKFDGDDAPAAGISVYQDVNRNGVQDSGENTVVTDANGHYVITVPANHADTYSIGVIRPTVEWLFTDAGHDGIEDIFAGPGSPTQHADFFLDPPDSAFPPNGVGLGTIQGVVYNDGNANGFRDIGENGVPNFRVFLDVNENGVWDSATEKSVLTAVNGSYFFTDVTPGLYRVDIVIPNEGLASADWSITKPLLGYVPVNLGAGGSVTGVTFALDNLADNDWGDLPNSYLTTAAVNGPRHHVTPGFQLGANVDGEVNGIPTTIATGEGQVGDDDDGVFIVSNGGILKKGTNTLQVTVAGVGGLLTGWMDFNADGHFDESERLTWSLNGVSLGGEADINPGTWNLDITVPANAVDNIPVAARFRWGEQGLSFAGASAIGEVEDYFLSLNYLFGDYNRNGTVDQADYNVWRGKQGQTVTPFTSADGNGDGLVNQADYIVWQAHFGQSLPAPGAGAGSGALVEGGGSSGAAAALVDGSSTIGPVSGGASHQVLGGVPAKSTDSMVATTSTESVSTTVSAQAFGAFLLDSDQSSSFRVEASASRSTVASATSANSNLLLLDLAWADVDSSSHDDAVASLFDDGHYEDTHVSDLALAAVISEDSNWWDSI